MSDLTDSPAERLAILNAETAAQRRRLRILGGLTQERLRPARLKQDVRNRMLDIGLDSIAKAKATVRRHPVRTAFLGMAVGAFVARRPLWKLLSQGLEKLRNVVKRSRKG